MYPLSVLDLSFTSVADAGLESIKDLAQLDTTPDIDTAAVDSALARIGSAE